MTDSISRCLQVHKVCEAGQAIGKGTNEGIGRQISAWSHVGGVGEVGTFMHILLSFNKHSMNYAEKHIPHTKQSSCLNFCATLARRMLNALLPSATIVVSSICIDHRLQMQLIDAVDGIC